MKLTPNPYNLIVPIAEGERQELKTKLDVINSDLLGNPFLPFARIQTIHFARLVILDASSDYPDQLVFSTNYDGPLDDHLRELLRCSNADMDSIFCHCVEYPEGGECDKVQWLKTHAQLRAYFYRGTWGLSKEQIVHGERYRRIAESRIDAVSDQQLSAGDLRKTVLQAVTDDPDFVPYEDYSVPKIGFFEVLKLIPIAIGLLILLLPCLIVLLVHEVADDKKEYDKKYSDKDRTRQFVKREDKIVQNQLTHLVEVKPGWFRLGMLKFVLGGIAYLAKYLYNRGKLGGIPSIHYARWIIIDGGRRLLFFSNFDGSWESYLGDFVDKAAVGLTGVWSNTRQFPKTRCLLFQGARDEQRFKSWARSKQHITNVWYSAYPDLTVTNIANNRALHKGLTGDLSAGEVEEWLMRY